MKNNGSRFKLYHVIFMLLILAVLFMKEGSKSHVAMAAEIMTQPFSVTEIGTNHAPSDITLSNLIIEENSLAGTTVALINVVDEDANDTFRYVLNKGAGAEDNICFMIIGNELMITTVPDFETKNSYSVRISVFDKEDLTCERSFKIAVTDVNETPTKIILSSNLIDEYAVEGTLIGTLSTVDEDYGDTFNYLLVSSSNDVNNVHVKLTGNTLSVADTRDYELRDNYSIKIITIDAAGLSLEQSLIIKVVPNQENDKQIIREKSPKQEIEESENNFEGEDGEDVVYNKDSEDVMENPSESKIEKGASSNAKLLKLNGVIVKGSRFILEVDDSMTSIDLNVTVSNAATWDLYSNATCTKPIKDNKIMLKVGKNKVYIKVTSQDKKYEKTYSVIIQRL